MRMLRSMLVCESLSAALAILPAGTARAAEWAWGTTASAPAGERAELFGIAAAAPDDVWAVGGYNPGQPPTAVLVKPYAEHWDGSAWTATPVPLGQVFAAQLVKLRGAAAVGAGDAWAVGHVDDVGSLAARTLAYRWNGSEWLRVATPNPAPPDQGNRLLAVVARGPGEAWAVGSRGYPSQSLAMRWNGSRWRAQATPAIGPLVAVAANGGAVVAAGSSRLMRTTDGSAWTLLPDPPEPQPPGTLLLAGVALKGGRLWAVGTVARPRGDGVTFGPYAATLKQSTWTLVSGAESDATSLTGVAASGDAVWASAFNGTAYQLGVDGAARQVTPPPWAGSLNAVAVDSLGQPWAAGSRYDGAWQPALYNAPGIGQGGIRVATGFAGASVTWIGPVDGSGTAGVDGRFSVGGLPAGRYQIVAAGQGCTPGVAEAGIKPGKVSAVTALVHCSGAPKVD